MFRVEQAEHFIQCRTQGEQLQLLSKVINSKETLEALERECGKEEAGGWRPCHKCSAGAGFHVLGNH